MMRKTTKCVEFVIFLFFTLIPVVVYSQRVTTMLTSNGSDTASFYDKNSPDKWKWNNERYWKSYEYLKNPDIRFFDWKNYSESLDGKQYAIILMSTVSGIFHGIGEAYHADPYVFERKWNVKEMSFWGSDAWKRNYTNNDPNMPHKHEWFANFGRDIWHTKDKIDVLFITIPIGLTCFRDQPKKYRILNSLLCMGARTVSAFFTYEALRS